MHAIGRGYSSAPGDVRRSALVSRDVPARLFFPAEGIAVTLHRDKIDQEGRGLTIAILFGTSTEVFPVRSVRSWLDVAAVLTSVIILAPSIAMSCASPIAPSRQ